jgi:magnesium chelatase family protein
MPLAEAINTTRLHQVTGVTDGRTAGVTSRPFRAPQHTLSDVGVIGGGPMPMPGEGSRAHHGLRFLDERPACRRYLLGVLCQPLETRVTSERSRARHRSDRPGWARCTTLRHAI